MVAVVVMHVMEEDRHVVSLSVLENGWKPQDGIDRTLGFGLWILQVAGVSFQAPRQPHIPESKVQSPITR